MKIFLKYHKEFEKNFKIKFTKPVIKIHSNGFISVVLDWSTKNSADSWKFKYPELAHRTFGGIEKYKNKKYFVHSASFEFPELDADFNLLKMPSWFDIVIGSETEGDYYSNSYEYVFFEKTKYGLVAWFGKKGWEDWGNTTDFKN